MVSKKKSPSRNEPAKCIMSITIAGDEVRCGLGDRIECSGSKTDKEKCPFWRNVIELGKLLEYGGIKP